MPINAQTTLEEQISFDTGRHANQAIDRTLCCAAKHDGSPLQIRGLLGADLPFLEHPRLNCLDGYALGESQYPFYTLIMPEAQLELIDVGRISIRKDHHSTFAALNNRQRE